MRRAFLLYRNRTPLLCFSSWLLIYLFCSVWSFCLFVPCPRGREGAYVPTTGGVSCPVFFIPALLFCWRYIIFVYCPCSRSVYSCRRFLILVSYHRFFDCFLFPRLLILACYSCQCVLCHRRLVVESCPHLLICCFLILPCYYHMYVAADVLLLFLIVIFLIFLCSPQLS